MSYRVRVRTEVVDEDGDVVDVRGVSRYHKSHTFPIQTQQDMFETEDVDTAREHMNKIYAIIKSIRSLNSDA